MCRDHYPPADQYLNHAEKSGMILVEAFKRMQVIEHEEPEDAAEENGEPDQQVSHVHSASYCLF
jgi:coatomer subunit beta'